MVRPGDELELPPFRERSGRAPRARPSLRGRIAAELAALRADPARMAALRDSWRALLASRALIWVTGFVAVLALGLKVRTSAFDPPGLTSGFGWLGDRLVAPAARWDSAWYLAIAHQGYEATRGLVASSRAAFFPLYPTLIGAIGWLGVPLVLGGILISLGALAVALYLLHRLATLEYLERARAGGESARLAPDAGRLTVLLMAFFPTAFFLSAVYSESLFLALSIGVFWSARRGRFVIACALAGFAAATRNAGVVLLVPIGLLYLYGPRTDRPPDRPTARWLWPRYRLRRDAWALALAPVGLLVYMGYLVAVGASPLLPFHAEAVWGRHFSFPVHTVWTGTVAAFDGVRQLLSGQTAHRYFAAGHGNPFITAQHNIVDWLFVVAAVIALVGVLRTLPIAYGAYVLATLCMPLSYPVRYEPLMSTPRFVLVLFPLFMWGGARLAARPRLRAPALVGSAACLLLFVAQFATWHWVA